jgi:disease resistance protein RPM1
MMLEVMVSKSLETNFVSLVGRQYGEISHGKVRRLSIHGDCDNKRKVEHRRARHGFEAMNLGHVRSLTTFQSEAGLSKLLDRLVEFKLLRVLDLEDCTTLQDKHMRSVCRLYLLRFLSMRGTSIRVLPNKIGDLEHLRSLDVQKTLIFKLPRTVTKLTKLERLMTNTCTWPRGIGKMRALQEVGTGVIVEGRTAQGIGELQQLQVLSVIIDTEDELIWRALAYSLENTYSLRVLNVQCHDSLTERDVMQYISSPPPLLRSFIIPFRIKQLPDWIPSLTHLVELCIVVYDQSNQLLDALCNLPNLESIILSLYFYVDPKLVAHNFQMLRSMDLCISGSNLTAIGFEVGSMAKLEKLELQLITGTRNIFFFFFETEAKDLPQFIN